MAPLITAWRFSLSSSHYSLNQGPGAGAVQICFFDRPPPRRPHSFDVTPHASLFNVFSHTICLKASPVSRRRVVDAPPSRASSRSWGRVCLDQFLPPQLRNVCASRGCQVALLAGLEHPGWQDRDLCQVMDSLRRGVLHLSMVVQRGSELGPDHRLGRGAVQTHICQAVCEPSLFW